MGSEQNKRYAFSKNNLSLNLKHIMLLKALLETESLSKTAAYLGIPISSASRDLGKLREVFEDNLFVFSGSRLVPTTKMLKLGKKLEQLYYDFGDLLDLNRNAAQTDDYFMGTIRVAANDNCFSVFIGSILPTLMEQSRRFKVETYPASMGSPEAIRGGLIDFLIVQDPFLKLGPHFYSKPLITSPHVVAMRRGHPLLRQIRENPHQAREIIFKHTLVQTPINMPSGFSGLPPAQQVLPNVLLQTPYFVSSLLLACKSDTAVICPRVLVKAIATDLPLDWVEIEDAEPWRPVLYWHDRNHSEPLHQCFRGLLEIGIKKLELIDQAS